MSLPCSAAFIQASAQRKIHTPIFEIVVLDITGQPLFPLHPSGGSLTRDRTRNVRGQVTFDCHGSLGSLVPTGTDPRILLPYGTEIRVSRGFEYLDGTQELLTRGTFRLTKTDLSLALEDGVGVTFEGSDRAERLDRELIAPFDANVGERYDDVIVRLLEQAWQGASPTASAPPFSIIAPLDSSGAPFTTPVLHFEARSNAWTEAAKMATACGRELFVTPDGAVALHELPDRYAQPVWDFVEGQNDTRIRLARSYASDNTPNYWTVNGTGPDVATSGESNAIFGVAFVDDPSTSLDVNGVYGTVPRFIDSVYSTTAEMCVAEAEAEKAKVLAGTDTIEIETTVIGHLLEGDVINVTCQRMEIVDEHYVIASIDEPLSFDGTMRLTAGRG